MPHKMVWKVSWWLPWLVWKYLRARSTLHAGSSLWLAVLGITIGVATLLSVLTGMNGLQSLLTDSIDEVSAYHLQIIVQNKADSLHIRDYLKNTDSKTGKKTDIASQKWEVANVTRFREAPMLVNGLINGLANGQYGESVVAMVRAVEERPFMRDVGRNAVMQTLGNVLDDDLQRPNHIWVGRAFSYEHGFTEGDSLQIAGAAYAAGGAIRIEQREFLVSAAYRLGNPSIESSYVFIGLHPQTEVLFSNKEYYLGIKLRQKGAAAQFKRNLERKLLAMQQAGSISAGYRIQTGREANRAFFKALKTEKSFLHVLVSLIFLVVAFQIFQSTRRSLYTRIPELMLLRSLGCGKAGLRGIFLLESLLVGLLGCTLGSVAGILASRYMNEILLWIGTRLFQNPALLPIIATDVAFFDLTVVVGSALVFCCAAAWLATKSLLALSPVEVLRNE